MREIVARTAEDLRWGRTTWRVLLLLAVPAFLAGIAAGTLQLG